MEQDALITCENCGAGNRVEARFCQKCGWELSPIQQVPLPAQTSPPPPVHQASVKTPPPKGNLIDDIIDEIGAMATDVRDIFGSLTKTLLGGSSKKAPSSNAPPPRQPGAQPSPASHPLASQTGVTGRMTTPTQMVSYLVAPKSTGEVVGGYVILETWPMQHSNYYRVRMERCPQGHINLGAPAERCATCQAELSIYLMRETDISHQIPATVDLQSQQLQQTRPLDKQNMNALIQLSRSGTAGFLKLAAVFDIASRRYAVSDYPGQGWQSLTQVNLPLTDHTLLANWILTLGQALLKTSELGFSPETASLADVVEPIIVVRQQIAFADLSIFAQRLSSPPINSTQVVNPQVAFLAQVLYCLASGKPQNRRRAPRDYSDVPPPFRSLMVRVDQNAFTGLAPFLEAIREAQKQVESSQSQVRSLRQIAGYSTDVGKKREHNEDFVGKYSLGMQQSADAPEVGLYLVADGMGGHQSGELASREVVRVILNEIQENVQALQAAPKLKRSTIKIDQVVSTSDVLKQAIQLANGILFNARQKIGSDRGTTLTAALVIGDLAAIANVGDSRTYHWREGLLKQITKDHSLVASLLAANMIRPDEVRSHPQRNQIFRTLGEKAAVEVDVYECPLRQGDRLLLCSDGLWEMVLDQEIQRILAQSSNPQEACDRLIEAANLAGGEDNISVVSVWMT